MTLEVRIQGTATLKQVAARMRAEGNKDLSRRLTRALAEASEPVKVAIKRSAEETMPESGGYAATFVPSMRFRSRRSGGGNSGSYTLVTYADGTGERRDIVALEHGRLRHPVFGRSRPGQRNGERIANPWTVTSIRAGFHRRGTDGAMDEAQKELMKVIQEFAHELIE